MSTNARNFDWGATKFNTNQIPGDVVGNENLQKNYKNLAEDFWQMADTINRIVGDGNDGFEGKWTSAFGDKAKDLATDLTNFGSSADVVSNALIYWQPLLQDHINDAKTHIDNYKNAKKAADNYYSQTVQPAWTDSQLKSQNVQSVNNQLDSTQAQIQSAQSAANNAQSHAEYVQHVYDGMAQSVQDEEDALQKVINDYNDDAKEVASRIDHATDDYIPSSFWDFTYSSAWRTIADFVGEASKWVGVFAMFVGFFIGGGPLVVVAAALAVASFAMNDAVDYAHGDESLGELVVAGVGVAASCVDAAGALRLMKAGGASFMPKFKEVREAGGSFYQSVKPGVQAALDVHEGSGLKAAKEVFGNRERLAESFKKGLKSVRKELSGDDYQQFRSYLFKKGTLSDFLNKIKVSRACPDGMLLGLNKEFSLGYVEAGKDLSIYRIGADVAIKGANTCISTVKTIQTIYSSDSSVVHKLCSLGALFGAPCKDAIKLADTVSGSSKW